MTIDTSHARVVVSGIGLITPLGADRETSWRALIRGERAVRWLDEFSVPAAGAVSRPRFAGAPLPASLAGPFPLPDPTEPLVEIARHAAREALDDARLDPAAVDRWRIGCVIGTSKGGLRSFAQAWRRRNSAEHPEEDWLCVLPSTPAAAVAADCGLGGPALCPVAACATGLVSLQRGVDLLRDGTCDYVLAGAADASLVPVVLASFQRLGVLARSFREPAEACRPFDRSRSGFAVGEGAAVMVLERAESALARGARPYAEWLGGGVLSDTAGLTALDPGAAALTHLIRSVLHRAGVEPEELDYANLHGTATRANDVCETRALKAALGAAAHRIPCSSLKGAVGHLLGAAGAVELAATLLALRDGRVPPTVNLVDPDPECDLDYVPGGSRRRDLHSALKLSLGFGGHLAAAVVRRTEDGRTAAPS